MQQKILYGKRESRCILNLDEELATFFAFAEPEETPGRSAGRRNDARRTRSGSLQVSGLAAVTLEKIVQHHILNELLVNTHIESI